MPAGSGIRFPGLYGLLDSALQRYKGGTDGMEQWSIGFLDPVSGKILSLQTDWKFTNHHGSHCLSMLKITSGFI